MELCWQYTHASDILKFIPFFSWYPVSIQCVVVHTHSIAMEGNLSSHIGVYWCVLLARFQPLPVLFLSPRSKLPSPCHTEYRNLKPIYAECFVKHKNECGYKIYSQRVGNTKHFNVMMSSQEKILWPTSLLWFDVDCYFMSLPISSIPRITPSVTEAALESTGTFRWIHCVLNIWPQAYTQQNYDIYIVLVGCGGEVIVQYIHPKYILNPNFVKTHLVIAYYPVSQSFWHFAQSAIVVVLCSV